MQSERVLACAPLHVDDERCTTCCLVLSRNAGHYKCNAPASASNRPARVSGCAVTPAAMHKWHLHHHVACACIVELHTRAPLRVFSRHARHGLAAMIASSCSVCETSMPWHAHRWASCQLPEYTCPGVHKRTVETAMFVRTLRQQALILKTTKRATAATDAQNCWLPTTRGNADKGPHARCQAWRNTLHLCRADAALLKSRVNVGHDNRCVELCRDFAGHCTSRARHHSAHRPHTPRHLCNKCTTQHCARSGKRLQREQAEFLTAHVQRSGLSRVGHTEGHKRAVWCMCMVSAV